MTKLALSLIATGALTLAMAGQTAQTSSSANAQNNQVQVQTQASASVDITTQIEKIQNADAKQRVELMNQLKEQVAAMSPEQRRATMQQLHVQMRNEAGNEHAQDQKVMEKVEEMLTKMEEHKMEMQEHAHEMQQNAHREMERNEHMNQREAGEQFKEQMQGHVETPMQEQFENSRPEGASGDMEGPLGARH